MFFQRKANIYRVALLQLLLASSAAWAATGGSISGFVTDPTGAFIQSATLTLVSDSQRTTYRGQARQAVIRQLGGVLAGQGKLLRIQSRVIESHSDCAVI